MCGRFAVAQGRGARTALRFTNIYFPAAAIGGLWRRGYRTTKSENVSEVDVLRNRPSRVRGMRTILRLDDDLAGLLKQRAQDLGVSFKEAVNRTIRTGLREYTPDPLRPAPKTIPHSFGFMPGIDLDKLGQFAE
jgi:hypothetical protein